MVLIIGGAYQGKLDYAKTTFHLSDEDVFICSGDSIDFSKRCIYAIEAFSRHCEDPIAYFKKHREEWENCILICQDIFCGVVPMGDDIRAWRQNTGRMCQYLSGEAEKVVRIFCGLEQRLK